MKNIILLEDDLLIVHLCQLLIFNRKITLHHFSNWNDLLARPIENNDYLVLDYSLLPKLDNTIPIIIETMSKKAQVIISSGYVSESKKNQFNILNKNEAIKQLANLICA